MARVILRLRKVAIFGGFVQRIEPILLLLAFLLITFAVMLFVCVLFFPQNGQIFTVVSGLVSAFSGAFMLRVKPKNEPGDGNIDDTSILKLNAPQGGSASASVEKKS